MILRPPVQRRAAHRGPQLAVLCLVALAAVLACLLGSHAAPSPMGAEGTAAPAQAVTAPASVPHADVHAGDAGMVHAAAVCAACSDEHQTMTAGSASLWSAILLGLAAVASVAPAPPTRPLALGPDTASRTALSGSERRGLLCISRT
ncbi:hypothetical protein ACFQ23_03220 [Schaalia naturae]|uniref:DUF2946 domain-containing protein n=1 Tax=Schaalia naturae TaxID=635203 RepID=A0ABW2SN15_9ACTO